MITTIEIEASGFDRPISGLGGDCARALAWVARNRADVARRHRICTGHDHPRFGDGALGRAVRSVVADLATTTAHAASLSPDCTNSVLAEACAPLAGPDPTFGALHFHRHVENPGWAETMIATALIGPFLFLRHDGGPTRSCPSNCC